MRRSPRLASPTVRSPLFAPSHAPAHRSLPLDLPILSLALRRYPTTTTTSSTTRSGRTRRAPRRLHFDGFFTNAGEHQLLRHLRDADPELYELKLLEWDYVIGRNDIDEATHPDLDDPDASELFFTVGGTENEPATDIDGNDVIELRGGAHHQPWSRDESEL